MMLPAARPMPGMVPSSTKPFDFGKPRQSGGLFHGMMRNPKMLEAFASLLAGGQQAQTARETGSPY